MREGGLTKRQNTVRSSAFAAFQNVFGFCADVCACARVPVFYACSRNSSTIFLCRAAFTCIHVSKQHVSLQSIRINIRRTSKVLLLQPRHYLRSSAGVCGHIRRGSVLSYHHTMQTFLIYLHGPMLRSRTVRYCSCYRCFRMSLRSFSHTFFFCCRRYRVSVCATLLPYCFVSSLLSLWIWFAAPFSHGTRCPHPRRWA